MEKGFTCIMLFIFMLIVPYKAHTQEVVYVKVYDEKREKAEKDARDGYSKAFNEVLLSQQKVLNYRRRMLIDNVFVTEFQREALNSDMNISDELIKLMERNIQSIRERINETWDYYDKEYMGNPEIAPIIEVYYNAKKKQVLEDAKLIDRKTDAFIKGKGIDNTIATPRQRMEIIREVKNEYQVLSGISLKQSSIFRMMVIGYLKQNPEKEEKE
mgnify:CR=1 FL=1|jgi:hypothetical protein